MRKLIQHIRFKFKVWRLRFIDKRKGVLTYKGQYYLKYLIDYYLNHTTDQTIEAYEHTIDQLNTESLRTLIEHTGMPARDAAAMMHFVVILECMGEKTRASYIKQVENSPYFMTILELLQGF